MVHLHRLIAFLLLALLSAASIAQTCPSGQTTLWKLNYDTGTYRFTSREAACNGGVIQSMGVYYNNSNFTLDTIYSTYPCTFGYHYAPSTTTNAITSTWTAISQCGVVDAIQACQDKVGQSAGNYNKLSTGTSADMSEMFGCEQYSGETGCTVQIQWDMATPVSQNPKTWAVIGRGKWSGSTCTYSNTASGTGTMDNPKQSINDQTPDTSSVTPSSCPIGQYYGQVNGTTVCVKPVVDSGITTTSNPSTTTTTSSNGTVTDTTTTRQTTCDATSCTTTTSTVTGTTPSGGTRSTATTSDSVTQSRSAFCSSNPTSSQCSSSSSTGSGSGSGSGGGGSFGGTCSGGFTCSSDDPALCAAAKAINEMNCQFQKSPGEVDAYTAAKTATEANTNATTNLPGNETKTISGGSFESTNLLGSGAGMTDKNITVMGHSVTLEFSRINDSLAMLKTILLAVSYLTAAAIVFRR